MMYLVLWAAFSLAVGLLATKRGRGSGNWFVLSILISPLLGIVFLLVLPNLQKNVVSAELEDRVKCPACAELVMAEATVCKHCGGVLVPDLEHSQRMASLRAHAASEIKTSNTLKMVTALAAFSFFIYIWIERHGGGW